MEEKIKQANPTLHRYLFTVTTFSKLLAMILFIVFPFVGFYLGMRYQKQITVNTTAVLEVQKTVILTPIPSSTSSPTPILKDEKIISKVGDKESSFLIQKINSGSVDGLWYQAYPVARGEGTPKTLHIGDDIGYSCEGVSEKLTSIDFSGQTITFAKIVGQRPVGGCPI